MKKLILLLLFTGFANAQDYKIINQLKSTDFDTCLKLADQMKLSAKNSYHLYKYKEFEKEGILKIVYAPEGITDEQLNISHDYSNCLVIEFKIYYEGNNESLEKKGNKKYSFERLEAKYLDVFPTWQKWFKPDADAEKTLQDSNSRELRDYDKNIQFYIEKNANNWSLRNDS